MSITTVNIKDIMKDIIDMIQETQKAGTNIVPENKIDAESKSSEEMRIVTSVGIFENNAISNIENINTVTENPIISSEISASVQPSMVMDSAKPTNIVYDPFWKSSFEDEPDAVPDPKTTSKKCVYDPLWKSSFEDEPDFVFSEKSITDLAFSAELAEPSVEPIIFSSLDTPPQAIETFDDPVFADFLSPFPKSPSHPSRVGMGIAPNYIIDN